MLLVYLLCKTAQSYHSATKMDEWKNERQIKQMKRWRMNEWVAVNKKYGYYPTLTLSSVSQVSAYLYTHTSAHAYSHVNHRLCHPHTHSSTPCSSSSTCMSPTLWDQCFLTCVFLLLLNWLAHYTQNIDFLYKNVQLRGKYGFFALRLA